jgi:hypothetical protein
MVSKNLIFVAASAPSIFAPEHLLTSDNMVESEEPFAEIVSWSPLQITFICPPCWTRVPGDWIPVPATEWPTSLLCAREKSDAVSIVNAIIAA